LSGEGIGPKASISASTTQIGDIDIGEERIIECQIENLGEIEA